MGKRRDDIVAEQRAQIAIEVLSPHRTWVAITNLQRTYGLSRQGIYDIAAKGSRVLRAGMKSGGYGPQPHQRQVEVNRNRLQRSVLALTEAGASQRSVVACLAEVLDTKVSLGWVNGQLAHLESAATSINQQWQPTGNETLSGDEMFANGQPNLLIVGNESLYIYAGIHALHFGYQRLLSKRFPFAIYYRLQKDFVRVYAILDCRRNPAWIRNRLT